MKINTKQKPAYDIIGDIHGHADELEILLDELGYNENNGHYRHPQGRKVVFLGDYIDRGPKIRRSLQIVRGMIDAGEAHGILGNHEVNALRFHTSDGNGGHLRKNKKENVKQHQATLSQIAEPFPDEWRDWMDWFAGLPLWLDLGPIRAVHASWNSEVKSQLKEIGKLEGETLRTHSIKKTVPYERISAIINGPEAILPEGFWHETDDGKKRTEFRVKWWKSLEGKECDDIVFHNSNTAMPDLLPAELPVTTPFTQDAPITFFGHYAIMKNKPGPILDNLACLDYGAGKGGQLVAYSWDGEAKLDDSKFTSTPQRKDNNE